MIALACSRLRTRVGSLHTLYATRPRVFAHWLSGLASSASICILAKKSAYSTFCGCAHWRAAMLFGSCRSSRASRMARVVAFSRAMVLERDPYARVHAAGGSTRASTDRRRAPRLGRTARTRASSPAPTNARAARRREWQRSSWFKTSSSRASSSKSSSRVVESAQSSTERSHRSRAAGRSDGADAAWVRVRRLPPRVRGVGAAASAPRWRSPPRDRRPRARIGLGTPAASDHRHRPPPRDAPGGRGGDPRGHGRRARRRRPRRVLPRGHRRRVHHAQGSRPRPRATSIPPRRVRPFAARRSVPTASPEN